MPTEGNVSTNALSEINDICHVAFISEGAGKGRYIKFSMVVHLPSKNSASYIPEKENIISNLIRMILVLLLVTIIKSFHSAQKETIFLLMTL